MSQQHPEGLLNPGSVETVACPSCSRAIKSYDQANSIRYLPGLPVGVKFDPSDWEILEHLEAKVMKDTGRMHPHIDEFIAMLEGEDGICCAHPAKLPGVSRDGQARHFFHRPLKAYSTGTRIRRKVQANPDGTETRWHKTGPSRPILINGTVKGFKKILVLYTNFGRQRRPEKANWVMHQYHLGNTEEERDGELVLSKVFCQTQPRLCGSSSILVHDDPGNDEMNFRDSGSLMDAARSTTGMMNRDPVEPFDDVRSTFIGISTESSKRTLAGREIRRFN